MCNGIPAIGVLSGIADTLSDIIGQIQQTSANEHSLAQLAARIERLTLIVAHMARDDPSKEQALVQSLSQELALMVEELKAARSRDELDQFFNDVDNAWILQRHNTALAQMIADSTSLTVHEVAKSLRELEVGSDAEIDFCSSYMRVTELEITGILPPRSQARICGIETFWLTRFSVGGTGGTADSGHVGGEGEDHQIGNVFAPTPSGDTRSCTGGFGDPEGSDDDKLEDLQLCNRVVPKVGLLRRLSRSRSRGRSSYNSDEEPQRDMPRSRRFQPADDAGTAQTAVNVLLFALRTLSNITSNIPMAGVLSGIIDPLLDIVGQIQQTSANERSLAELAARVERLTPIVTQMAQYDPKTGQVIVQRLQQELELMTEDLKMASARGKLTQFFNNVSNASTLQKTNTALDRMITDSMFSTLQQLAISQLHLSEQVRHVRNEIAQMRSIGHVFPGDTASIDVAESMHITVSQQLLIGQVNLFRATSESSERDD
ncbi:hypothetical protein MSAN_00540000 [Mycena sanguinolenta]|uniref:Uncharacterized protein n=1 Tax=Mycena sanguinolenta TaxID=230812 RepID=A0A8H6Z9A4_9AGAR|nr:hypothetical protein MSAN_00540000 [Mycena sanguinolenta]